jgi:DNA-binding MarR family transcriptional regulator
LIINLLDIRTGARKNVKVSRPKNIPTLTYLIKWMERKVRQELEEALASLEVSVPEYTALSVLSEGRELSSAQLARRTFVTAQAMHPIVIALIERNLLVRRADPDHGRIHLVRLTERGQKTLADCNAACANAEARAFSGLSRAETETLRKALEKCVRTIGQGKD